MLSFVNRTMGNSDGEQILPVCSTTDRNTSTKTIDLH